MYMYMYVLRCFWAFKRPPTQIDDDKSINRYIMYNICCELKSKVKRIELCNDFLWHQLFKQLPIITN